MKIDKNKFILDACCSVKAMWTNKSHPNTVYIDLREEQDGFMGYGRKEGIHPDYVMDFRKMDFPDKSFKLVVFEPPHLSKLGKTSLFRNKFGCLNTETWPIDLKQGFNECWRVLDDFGTLVFKWSSSEIPFDKILKLAPAKPLFYNTTNYKSTSVTKWFCFMKIPELDNMDDKPLIKEIEHALKYTDRLEAIYYIIQRERKNLPQFKKGGK